MVCPPRHPCVPQHSVGACVNAAVSEIPVIHLILNMDVARRKSVSSASVGYGLRYISWSWNGCNLRGLK